MKIKFKKLHKDLPTPTYSKYGDACLDLTIIDYEYEGAEIISYKTGICLEIPKGYVGLLFPRSSIFKKDLILTNSVGVIDSGYRGEITFKFKRFGTSANEYQIGDRCGQIMILPIPKIELEEVDELSGTERGETGYGSTGN